MTRPELDFPFEDARRLVRTALDEDLGPRHLDVTTLATIPADQVRSAEIVARATGIVAGLPVVPLVFDEVSALVGTGAVETELLVADGAEVDRGDVVARVGGPLRTVLIAERTLLNIVCRLSGIATHTRRWADMLEGTGAMVLDTRKTTPGMRVLEKYAVRAGGGTNKRMGLYDVAMIKDNHKLAAGSVAAAHAAVRALREQPEDVEIEATGGLTLDVAREYALTGVDYLSVGGLTHSSPILDLALDLAD